MDMTKRNYQLSLLNLSNQSDALQRDMYTSINTHLSMHCYTVVTYVN